MSSLPQESGAKLCSKCGIIKPIDRFSVSKRAIGNRCCNCKDCDRLWHELRQYEWPEIVRRAINRKEREVRAAVGVRQCPMCFRWLAPEHYTISRYSPTGRHPRCKYCLRDLDRARRWAQQSEEQREKIREAEELSTQELKRCSVCRKVKDINEFRLLANEKTRRGECIECALTLDHRYKNKHRERIRHRDRNHHRKVFLKQLYWSAKGRARDRQLPFDIDMAYLQELWTKSKGKCCVSGLAFQLTIPENLRSNPFRPSLDRIIPCKGYVKGNVRIVLWGVNAALWDFGFETYLKIASAVIEKYQASGGAFSD